MNNVLRQTVISTTFFRPLGGVLLKFSKQTLRRLESGQQSETTCTRLRSLRRNFLKRNRKNTKPHRIVSPKNPFYFLLKTGNQERNRKNPNSHQNRKKRTFLVQKPKSDLKNGRNRKTEKSQCLPPSAGRPPQMVRVVTVDVYILSVISSGNSSTKL